MADRRTELRKVARKIASDDRRLSALARAPQLADSSVEDGAVDFYDADGNLAAVIGKQWDGAQGVAVMTGPTPPTPTAPILGAGINSLTVRWDGVFGDVDGNPDLLIVPPMDFSRVEVHVSVDPELIADEADTLKGTIESPRGGEITVSGLDPVPYYVRLVTRSLAGKAGAASVVSTATPTSPSAFTPTEIDAAVTTITNAGSILLDAQKSLDEKLAEPVPLDNLAPGTDPIDETVTDKLFADVVVAKMALAESFIGSNAILDEAVTAPKIVASEELWAKVLGAHRINAAEIDVDSLTADAGFIADLEATIVSADMFTGKTFVGGTFRGANFETEADVSPTERRGIKLDSALNALLVFDADGDNTFLLDGETGAFSAVGDVSTGFPGQPGVTLRPGMNSFGLGQAVIELFSGDPNELAPAEQFINRDNPSETGNTSLQLWSPRLAQGGRASLQLYAADADSAATAFLTDGTPNNRISISGNGRVQLTSTLEHTMWIGASNTFRSNVDGVVLFGSGNSQVQSLGNQTDLFGTVINLSASNLGDTGGTPAIRMYVNGGFGMEVGADRIRYYKTKLVFDGQYESMTGVTYGANFVQSNYPIHFTSVDSTALQTIRVAHIGSTGNTTLDSDSGWVRVGGTMATAGDWAAVLRNNSDGAIMGLYRSTSGTYVRAAPIYGLTTGSAANVYIRDDGIMFRSTSSRRNKLAIEHLGPEIDDKILSLKAATWFDKNEAEAMAEFKDLEVADQPTESPEGEPLTLAPSALRRIPGMIGEEVAEAGLEQFVVYGEDGQVEGLMYDRLGVALIPVVARLRDRLVAAEFDAMVLKMDHDALEAQVAALTARLDAAGL